MEGVHGRETEPTPDAYDFSALKTVVEIGGGNGSLLSEILKRNPAIQGLIFDLPAVAERTRSSLSGSSLAGRIQIQGGNFFTAIPAGADAYVLRHIVDDGLDPDAVAILRKCRDAMTPESKLLVVEMVIPPGNEHGFGRWLDLMMLLVAGQERTEEEYGRLFAAAGADVDPCDSNRVGCQHRRRDAST